jgi:hypothetical protein
MPDTSDMYGFFEKNTAQPDLFRESISARKKHKHPGTDTEHIL